MYNKIYDKLLKLIFSKKTLALETEYRFRIKAEEDRLQNLDIRDVVRERLKGLRPKRVNDLDLYDEIVSMSKSERLGFLSKVYEIQNNEQFKRICDEIIKEQMLKIAKESGTMEEVNFARATINGIEIIEESIKVFSDFYLKERSEGITTLTDIYKPI